MSYTLNNKPKNWRFFSSFFSNQRYKKCKTKFSLLHQIGLSFFLLSTFSKPVSLSQGRKSISISQRYWRISQVTDTAAFSSQHKGSNGHVAFRNYDGPFLFENKTFWQSKNPAIIQGRILNSDNVCILLLNIVIKKVKKYCLNTRGNPSAIFFKLPPPPTLSVTSTDEKS